ncbi:MAG: hypothetical protein JW775_08430, partial [Candidatus Aminicenantes bacterium]|nr:hypothetical protein [Candidatus Aminicenantes bacterium]
MKTAPRRLNRRFHPCRPIPRRRSDAAAFTLFALAAGFLSATVAPAALRAQEFRTVRVEEGPRVDGRLDDPVWREAPIIDGFRMVEPRPGEDPSERTEA